VPRDARTIGEVRFAAIRVMKGGTEGTRSDEGTFAGALVNTGDLGCFDEHGTMSSSRTLQGHPSSPAADICRYEGRGTSSKDPAVLVRRTCVAKPIPKVGRVPCAL